MAIEKSPVPEAQTISRYTQAIARTIGGPVTPSRVDHVLRLLNNHHLVHGIKDHSHLARIQTQGILPLTPEGGQVSFWTTREGVFGYLTSKGELQTYDTSFFHYAHSANPPSNRVVMNLAITNRHLLNLHHITHQPGSYCTINHPVPRHAIALIQVSIPRQALPARQLGQLVEQQLFLALESALIHGYTPGDTITRYIQ